jgi:hypothetical protein
MHITQDALGLLTETEKQEFEIWQELIDSRGYRQLIEYLQGHQKAVSLGIDHAPSWEDYLYNRGQRDAFNVVIQLPEILEAQIAAKQEAVEEAALEPEDEYDEVAVNLGLVE